MEASDDPYVGRKGWPRMTTYDAWIVRRLLCDKALNAGEIEAVGVKFQPLAVQLAGLPLGDRQKAFNAFLDGRSDDQDILTAVTNADPEGQAPDLGEQEGDDDGWGPIRVVSMALAPSFPLDVLPDDAARLVEEGAASIGCPPDFIAVSMLAVAGGAIGRSVALLLKPNYFASSCLYVACVGPPSNGKTPAFKVAIDPIRRIGSSLAADHERDMQRGQESELQEKKSKPAPKPKPRRIDVDDITMEAVPMRLADNPRGLIMLRDELSALLLGMNQYKGGKGSDRSVILKIWSGDAITRDRVLDPSGIPLRCPHPCMSILGGLPPDMLGALHDDKGSADGFTDRFLFTFPEPVKRPEWSELGIPPSITDAWAGIVERMWDRPMRHHEGKDVPHVAHFTPEGKAAWKEANDQHVAEMNDPGFLPSMSGPWGKLGEYAGRFALILACLRHASDLTLDAKAVPEVGHEEVKNAWRLVDYFKAHAQRAHSAIARGSGIGGSETVQVIVKWLRDDSRSSFTERDLTQARRSIDRDDLSEALTYLADRNVVRPREAPTGNRGRPGSPVYDVNPALLITQKPQNTQ